MIHVEDLTKYYHDLCAVDQISFDVHKGEILGLLGPNGAGKTTTLRMLTGLLKPTAGTVRIKDYTVQTDALSIKKMMGYLPETTPLYKDMLVFDYLDYVASIRELKNAEKDSQIRYLADLCGLKPVMHQPIGELSKGYRQRVGLAHAMMNDPDILVLDEPTSSLDPNQIVEIRNIIRQIGKEKTIILSTHILSEAEATCDRVVIINRGKIVADDRMENLRQSADSEKVIYVTFEDTDVSAVQKLLGTVAGVERIEPLDDNGGRTSLQVVCSAGMDIRGDIYRKIRETDWVLTELYQETQTLENIFRQITREK
jgi:ABC-2 type transport system ATP-binding protein